MITAAGTAALPLRIREFRLEIAGALIGAPDTVRQVASRVRVRADCLRPGLTQANTSSCVASPSS